MEFKEFHVGIPLLMCTHAVEMGGKRVNRVYTYKMIGDFGENDVT